MKQIKTLGSVLHNKGMCFCVLIVFVSLTVAIFLYNTYFVALERPNRLPSPTEEEFTLTVEEYSAPITRKSVTLMRSDGNSEEEVLVQAIRKPYRFDKTCANFTKRLYRPGTFNLTALASFPGSGNTWTRHLIELTTGIYTGSIYFDLELIAKGFIGEKETWTSGTTIAQKTHEKFNQDSLFTKAILLIRDPYKSIISFVQYLEAGHTAASSGHIFRKEGWENYTLGQTYKWMSLLKSWIEAPIPVLVIHYEHLKDPAKLQSQMSEICKFLNIDCIYVNSSCFRRHKEGEFHRKRKPTVTPSFPLWARHKIDDGIDYLNDLLQKRRGDSLPLNMYPYYRNYSKI